MGELLFGDEYHLTVKPAIDPVTSYRARMRRTFVAGAGGWNIGERFDNRFDTEVGGTILLASNDPETGLPVVTIGGPIAELQAEQRFAPRPSAIVDYANGGRQIAPSDAEGRPELAAVLVRLREREAEYASRLGKKS